MKKRTELKSCLRRRSNSNDSERTVAASPIKVENNSNKPRRTSRERCTKEKKSVTVITSHELPSYSAERSYLLNEIEEHSYSIQNLHDLAIYAKQYLLKEDEGEDDECDEEDINSKLANHFHISSYCVLYLIWDLQKSSNTAETNKNDFINTMIIPAVSKLIGLYSILPKPQRDLIVDTAAAKSKSIKTKSKNKNKSSITSENLNIYLVIDQIISTSTYETSHIQNEIKATKEISQDISKNTFLRTHLQGVSIGITTSSRTSPACDAIVNTVLFASSSRRKLLLSKQDTLSHVSTKSNVSIITLKADDLLYCPTDLAQKNPSQCMVITEWKGNGNLISFAKRSFLAWKRRYQFVVYDDYYLDYFDTTSTCKSRFLRNHYQHRNKFKTSQEFIDEDPVLSFMISVFWIAVLVYLWNSFGRSFFMKT